MVDLNLDSKTEDSNKIVLVYMRKKKERKKI